MRLNDAQCLMGNVVFIITNAFMTAHPELQFPAAEVCATEEARRSETVFD